MCLARVKAEPGSVQPISSLVSVLLERSPSAEDRRLAAPALDEALVKWKDNPDVLSQIASAWIMQQRFSDGEKLLRQVVALSPKSVVALNNLATLLGEQAASVQEARELIDRALEIAGPQPVLLDTKGMILVQEGRPKEAVPLLEAAASGPYADPRFSFHLAMAHARAGDMAKARGAFGKVDRAELEKQVLTPTDRTYLKELEAKLR
jgi:Flp pilus assembly protein TadD